MKETGPIRVMLIDDHALLRSAVRQALAGEDMVVVGEAASAEEALDLAPVLRPDVLLLDINLPGMSGLALVRELAARLPDTKIVMLTVSTSQRDVFEAIRFGASGYLTKDLTPDALRRTVRAVSEGDLAMTRRTAAQVIRQLVVEARSPRSRGTGAGLGSLSIREQEILRLLDRGLTDQQIADMLMISPRTVSSHVSSILHKLRVRNRAEAARRFVEERGGNGP